MKKMMTPTQTRIWFLQQLQPEVALYHVSVAVRLSGLLNIDKLHHAIQQVGQQHDILRSYFRNTEGIPERWEADTIQLDLPVSTNDVDMALCALAKRPFPLQTAPLIRFELVQQAANQHTLLIVAHRLIADGASLQWLVQGIAARYAGEPGCETVFAPQLTESETSQAYWLTQLADLPLLLELPFDYARAARQTDRGAQVQFPLAESAIDSLRQMAASFELPLESLLLALFKTLLYRYTGQTDIIVGEAVNLAASGVAPHENNVVLRTHVDPTTTLAQLAQTIQQTRNAAYAHASYPFARLAEQLQPGRDLSHTPIFQISFACQSPPNPLLTGDLQWQSLHLADGLAAYDLSLSCTINTMGDSVGRLTYNADLFAQETIARMAGHLQQLLAGATAVPTTPLTHLPLLTPVEQTQIKAWNSTTLPYDRAACMHHLFERQVVRCGEETAVTYLDQTMSYAEVNGRANQLARHLQTMGVQPGDFVAVCMERTLDLVISLYAILKVGAAYVPLDPDYPADRIQYMMNDSQACVILTQRALHARLPQHNAQVWQVDTGWLQLANNSSTNLDVSISPDALAYIIYTSGSTGRPKGVAIAHRNAVAMISWAQSLYSADELAGVLASTSVCFDLSVYELFVPLASGGGIILARNALHLIELPNREQVTLINTVPSAMTALVRAEAVPASVRVVNLAGEPLKDSLVQAIYALGTVEKVYDLYGPSEDTTYSTWLLMAANVNKEPSVGWPIANTQAHVLDQQMQPVPIGIVGELYLGGDGVATGYLHRPELT
ncbi:MAG: AMP-binding protein, partial [Chloroflexi bacterium]|nr:AMP-binding protein [Chloroflexota bacterium]